MKYLKIAKSKINIFVVIMSLIIFILGMIIMRQSANRVSEYAGGETILDLRMGYSEKSAKQYLEQLGKKGREEYYNNFYKVDLFYPLTYTLFYFCAIAILLKKCCKEKNKLDFLLLLPIFGLIFDWGENLFIRSLINQFPDISQVICQTSSIFTMLKFIFVYSSLLSIVCLKALITIKQTCKLVVAIKKKRTNKNSK